MNIRFSTILINNNKKFSFILFLFILLVFILNINHQNQQGTYEEYFREISNNLLWGSGYTCAAHDYQPAFYPLWGYTFLVAVDTFFQSTNIIILAIQLVLCYFGIKFFYKLFDINPRYYHLLLFLPYVAICSVKLPDAIVIPLLTFFVYSLSKFIELKNLRYLIYSGVILGIISNFRGEYLYLPIFIAICLLFTKDTRKKAITTGLVLFIINIICLLLWALRSVAVTGEFRLSSTNSGAVLYNTLGQLEDNPWKIKHIDKSSFDFVREKGVKNPYSPEGDKLLTNEFNRLIKEHPEAFAMKSAVNLSKSFLGGVYTGEYGNLFIKLDKRIETDELINNTKGIFNKINVLFSLPSSISIPLVIEKLIQAFYIPILIILYISFAFVGIIKKSELNNSMKITATIVVAIIIYKLLTVSLIQYEYRHININYVLLLGFFLTLLNKFSIIKRKIGKK